MYIRIKRYLSDKLMQVKWWPHKFKPFSDKSRDTNSCVVVNGIPKCGTNLGGRIVQYLDKWQMLPICIAGGRWTVSADGDAYAGVLYDEKCPPNLSVQRLRNGQFITAHISWHKRNEKAIVHQTSKRRIKHIFMYRDPRDAWVSRLNYVMKVGALPNSVYKGTREALLKYSSDEARLEYIIKRVNTRSFSLFTPWLHSSHCHAIKFEDLYSDVLRLQNNIIGDTLSKLFTYLEIDEKSIEPVHLFNYVYNKGRTASGEKNKVGQYLRYFKKQHYDLLDNPDFKGMLHSMGYKW